MRLSLDQLEAEQGEVEPFELDLGDDGVVSLPHPRDLPFEVLLTFDGSQPASILQTLMGDDAFDAFTTNPRVTLGILEKILDAYYKHYGLGSPGESGASPRSVNGSARQSRRTSQRSAKT
jgi:hypothetical protein